MVYEPGSKNPSDYASRHHPEVQEYSALEREKLGVEDSEEDVEIVKMDATANDVPPEFDVKVSLYKLDVPNLFSLSIGLPYAVLAA